mmetsp:Transcript_45986/g.103880  ORF Transcript_45986/g.103880 Transcript_45986/m.103880 type:complete len:213 (-) Transcript_45986:897-1535(-)
MVHPFDGGPLGPDVVADPPVDFGVDPLDVLRRVPATASRVALRIRVAASVHDVNEHIGRAQVVEKLVPLPAPLVGPGDEAGHIFEYYLHFVKARCPGVDHNRRGVLHSDAAPAHVRLNRGEREGADPRRARADRFTGVEEGALPGAWLADQTHREVAPVHAAAAAGAGVAPPLVLQHCRARPPKRGVRSGGLERECPQSVGFDGPVVAQFTT